MNILRFTVLIGFMLLALPRLMLGQTKVETVDKCVIDALTKTYDKVIFEDNFKNDSVDSFPRNWKFYVTNPTFIANPLNYYSIKGYKGLKVLSIYWGVIERVQVSQNSQPVALSDSFTLEFDFLAEKYSVAYDTARINSFIRCDTFKRRVDWPSTSHSTGGRFGVYEKPTGDTFNKVASRVYVKAKFIPDFDKWVWNHCIIHVKGREVIGYITAPTPFIVFTDTVFNLKHMALGRWERMLYKNISIKASTKKAVANKKFDVLAKDRKMVTHAIRFDVNKAVIKTDNTTFLNELSEWLYTHPDVQLEIVGHTDNEGSAEENQLLSERRAKAIKVWLVKDGIAASRLTTKGYGASKPLDTNSSPEGRAINRRVELVLR